MNTTDKTLEDKIYRVLLIHGQDSKEIAKIVKAEIQNLIDDYQKRHDYVDKRIKEIIQEGQLRKNNDELQRCLSSRDIFRLTIKDLGELLK